MKFVQILIPILLATVLAVIPFWDGMPARAATDQKPSAFDGQRAYGYLKDLCRLGPRISGTPGMRQQQALLEKYFTDLGGQVEYQRFQVKRHPRTGRPVPMANLIVHWHPAARQRLLLCTHYDTRPLPARDPNPRLRQSGVFLGANDGASGTALLMELGRHIATLQSPDGIDFVFFDGEELVYEDPRDPYFLGSQWFARQYREHQPQYGYRYGVLLDMVGDSQLTLYQERYSMSWPDTRPLVEQIWATASRLGVKEFIPQVKYEVRDDHLPLHQIAGIPTCDIIDFWYPDRTNRFWHTTQDAPGRCSASSLDKVGRVLLAWLREQKAADASVP
jgi:hypothetical protein